MKVVVTGHRGFVGQHLMKAIVGQGNVVTGLDRRDSDDITGCFLPAADRVYHLAAQTDAQYKNATQDASVNIMATLRLLERYGDRVVFASSSMVNYPTTPYAISKRAAEDYVAMFGAATVRFCNLYGPGGHSVIDKFRAEETITIRGSGEQLRTYADVAVAVNALIAARPGTLTVLPGQHMTVNQIAARMFPDKPIRRVPALITDIIDGRQLTLPGQAGAVCCAPPASVPAP